MNMLRKLKDNHDGITFIEMLVCFSLLIVMMSVASFSLGLTAGTQAKETTQTINAMISRTKVGALTRTGNVYMIVYMDSKNQIVCEYYENGGLREGYTVSSKDKVQVGYTCNSSSCGTCIGGSYHFLSYTGTDKDRVLYLSFNRNTGGFETVAQSAILGGDSAHTVTGHCTEIFIWGGTQTGSVVDYSITLGPVTGTHFMNGLK